MFCGIETFDKKTAAVIGKGGDREKLLNTARYIKEKYKDTVSIHGSFIFGLPHESMESLNSTAEYLLSDQNPLDTWAAYPLNIRSDDKSYSQEFLSDIDINYKKHGYENIGIDPVSDGSLYSVSRRGEGGQMKWRNEFTSSDEIEQLCSAVNNLRRKKDPKIGGQSVFYFASLGLNLEDFLNKTGSQVNWHEVDKVKLAKCIEYKTKLFQQLGVTPNFLDIKDIKTFSDLLRSKKLVEL
jgi:radical SAM superfamily enzyme YgiQ (UPF0313 family)